MKHDIAAITPGLPFVFSLQAFRKFLAIRAVNSDKDSGIESSGNTIHPPEKVDLALARLPEIM